MAASPPSSSLSPPSSPPPSWVLLNPSVDNHGLGIDPTQKGWEVVECRKDYCGAGKYGHMMAGCLELHVRRAADPLDLSELAISANDEIVRYIIEGELSEQAPEDKSSFPCLREVDVDMMEGPLSYVTGYVRMADENLIVLSVSFPFTDDQYYLVYDAILQSMSMIPHISSGPFCQGYSPSNPLPVRCGDMCTLVHFARNMEYDEEEGEYIYRDMLCLWPPPPSSKLPPPPLPNAYTCPSIEPWYFMEPCFPMEMTLVQFRHHVKFTSSSYAFWADLTQGVLCCCCSDIFGDNYSVDFSFIELPPGCEYESCDTLDVSDIGPAEMFRTIGCTTGDSIKFISISFDDSVPETEKTVTEWMLDMATMQWTKVEELSLGTLWELEDFKKYGLPKTKPLYPLLRKGEEDDGALYFILSNGWDDYAEHYMCRLDMRSKRLESTRLSSPQGFIGACQLVGSEFFRYLQNECLEPAHGKGKMKLNEAYGAD
uniref:DUF1618 domain-containing protein n=1 Tax=Oryza glumipatula TaxID=40148 RepID=A0A0D9ZDA4_9ORYZ